eukprot:TRINITY_DN325_c0_g1_i7.p1 TRINITY_DN325_c0_g1~~TRINITY_DN325_c0_g1_i7.p1  ORF type:complete len:106 (+),score=9.97 TRINITY_DN325_c0_g1_i7:15-332(+)
MSSSKNLLIWVQSNVNHYPGVQVTNFGKCWADGLAFCALIHACRPELLDFNSLDKDPASALTNLRIAFTAFKQMGVPALLDAEDVVEIQEPKSIQTQIIEYVSFR